MCRYIHNIVQDPLYNYVNSRVKIGNNMFKIHMTQWWEPTTNLFNRWRCYDWITLSLFMLGLVACCLLLANIVFDFVPMLINVLLSLGIGYIAFTVLHEAVHANLFAGDSKRQSVQSCIAWLASLPFIIIPAPIFKTMHMQHHAHLNDPKRDPDYFCHADNLWIATAKAPLLAFYYIYRYSKWIDQNQLSASDALQCLVYYCVWITGISLAVTHGWGVELLLYAVIPALVNNIILTLVLDHIVHHPHTEQDAHLGTHSYDFFGAKWLTLGQNAHVVHHVLPRVPWHSYTEHLPEVLTQKRAKQALPDDRPTHNISSFQASSNNQYTACLINPRRDTNQRFMIDDAETILQAAIRQDVALPYGCKAGMCGRCKIHLSAASAIDNAALTAGITALEAEQGWVLACQTCVNQPVTLTLLK